jgi:hypothetical protein
MMKSASLYRYRVFDSIACDGGFAHHPEITVRTAYDLKP